MPHVPPPKWKMSIVIWIAIYPAITLISYLVGPLLAHLIIPLRTLVMTAVLVPLMVYVLLPFLQKLFSNWLFK